MVKQLLGGATADELQLQTGPAGCRVIDDNCTDNIHLHGMYATNLHTTVTPSIHA
jgi:hypothetical protein